MSCLAYMQGCVQLYSLAWGLRTRAQLAVTSGKISTMLGIKGREARFLNSRPENVGSQFLSLRQLPLGSGFSVLRGAAKNLSNGGDVQIGLWTAALVYHRQTFSLRPYFSEALNWAELVRS
jgi:hypothetical protein